MKRIAIMGAAGRDFHNFNMVYRGDPAVRVVAFTAAQIPEIAGRRYPAVMAGPGYPDGIPIVEESELAALCRREAVDQVVFAYSDIAHGDVMHKASLALGLGADFILLGPASTMLTAGVPTIAVSAVRTGCGKSQTTRWLAGRLKGQGQRVAVIRHPMPYGDLVRQRLQRFATRADLDAAQCTVEEREEYEPHLAAGIPVFAGVDYRAIVAAASAEADILLWDGGNNDFPFVRPDLHIVLVDPLRPGDETAYHPGEAVLRMADVVVVAKANGAREAAIRQVRAAARALNPTAPIVRAASIVRARDPDAIRGMRVLVIEDGPTLTHGGMSYGAGLVAAQEGGAAEIVDPHPFAVGAIAEAYRRYSHIGPVLPALGYFPSELDDLKRTVARIDADLILSATPCDLAALIDLGKPVVRVSYEFAEMDDPGLGRLVDDFLARPGTTAKT